MEEKHVVVTGMGIVSSIGEGIKDFRDALMQGKSGIERLNQTVGSEEIEILSAPLKDFSVKDSLERMNLPDEEQKRIIKMIRRMPKSIQTSVIAALQASKQAGFSQKIADKSRCSIQVAGNNLAQSYMYETMKKFIKTDGFVSPTYGLQFFDSNFIGVLSEVLGVHGEGMTTGGASASGNVAILQAYRLIRYGIADVCICVGPQFEYSQVELQAFMNLGAIGDYSCFTDPKEACRPFDSEHKGFIPGQASGCLILESLEHALSRGGEILAEVAGGAMVLDANHLSNANIMGEMKAMEEALADAGIEKEQINYLNAHGTSTPSGDLIESEAIAKLFQECTKDIQVNSTKCMTGHCMYSAGIVECIASVIQMKSHFVHGNINLKEPVRSDIRFVGNQGESWDITYAMSNSFAFGGINTAIILKNK